MPSECKTVAVRCAASVKLPVHAISAMGAFREQLCGENKRRADFLSSNSVYIVTIFELKWPSFSLFVYETFKICKT